jgi:hypothetical protein
MKSFPTTVTWHYVHDSVFLYLDSNTIKWMFPGLAFTIPGSSNSSEPYVVTGVWPDLGYISAMDVSGASGGRLHGAGYPMVDTCLNRCSIGQAAYSWTAY